MRWLACNVHCIWDVNIKCSGFCVLLINTLVLVGEANLEEVGDVMAVAGLLKLFLVRRDCQVLNIQLCSILARQVCELLRIFDVPMMLG